MLHICSIRSTRIHGPFRSLAKDSLRVFDVLPSEPSVCAKTPSSMFPGLDLVSDLAVNASMTADLYSNKVDSASGSESSLSLLSNRERRISIPGSDRSLQSSAEECCMLPWLNNGSS